MKLLCMHSHRVKPALNAHINAMHHAPTTPQGYVGIRWRLDTFGSHLPCNSGSATSQVLFEYMIQAIRVAY